MAEIILPNYSDDSRSKDYIMNELMPRVFHDVPMNNLNIGMFSIISEYLSQGLENQAFTSSFFFNESFITKAVLPDSIYSEAAIFNIGYSFATPSCCVFLLELKLEDIFANATLNADTGLYEFILDKNTKINLTNGNVYSLDYDILLQYKNRDTATVKNSIPAWNVQYINTDQQNSIAVNKNVYITYRVTDTWLCLYITASEYSREVHTVVNNLTNGLPNDDTVISCLNHICGFDIKYIDGDGNEQYIPKEYVLPVNSDVPDKDHPYVHYMMDNPQTIRFMWQLYGSKYFVPPTNTSYEITVYTCHGESANFTAFNNEEQPIVISASNKYFNNGNVMKNAWLASGSLGGTNIGNVETVRRETIEAYNTANVISTDHDIDEWIKTFFFKNILYPFFFKRRDDPWGRIWSGYLALKDNDDYIFRTNTLQANIPYDILYANNDNTVSENEIIIPPGWTWIYDETNNPNTGAGLYTVIPYTKSDSLKIESADTQATIDADYVFANPFGIRIQKSPFAMAYFNPWINESTTVTRINRINQTNKTFTVVDDAELYHATPILTNIKRTYKENYYNITSFIDSTIDGWIDGSSMVKYMQSNSITPTFSMNMWNYFKQPLDLYSSSIPIVPLTEEDGYIAFDPDNTFFCVTKREKLNNGSWLLSGIYIRDKSTAIQKKVQLPITGGDIIGYYGSDDIWGDQSTYWEPIYVSGDTSILLYTNPNEEQEELVNQVSFNRITTQNYYEMRLKDSAQLGLIERITIDVAVRTELTKYDEDVLWRMGNSQQDVIFNVYFQGQDNPVVYRISNPANVYTPYSFTINSDGLYETTDVANVGPSGIILYADMKPTPESGAIDYYQIPFSKLPKNVPMFRIENQLLPVSKNNMRVLLTAMVNGVETGKIEMQPVSMDADGTYRFEARMYPLNEMVDLDNRINIASIDNGGGSWIPETPGSVVNIDATNPEFKITILVRSQDETRDSEITIGDDYTGFIIVDEYSIDPISLVQELKEMRSVVTFGDTSTPTPEQVSLFDDMISLTNYNEDKRGFYEVQEYAYNVINEKPNVYSFNEIKSFASSGYGTLYADTYGYTDSEEVYHPGYVDIVQGTVPAALLDELETINNLIETTNQSDVDWDKVYSVLYLHMETINDAFDGLNIHGGLSIQLVPFTEYTLMTSDRFESFVSSFTQIHKAIEPVIMKRLEGNNYLDCKLIATYGKPHSYVADVDANSPLLKFWPDLDVQLEFDVYVYNQSLTSNTISELRTIVKSYFNRLTSIHTPVDIISMDANIYMSNLIQQMKAHDNVAWLRFKGWYTDDKNNKPSKYKDANTQGIVRRRKTLEEMTTAELESYVPEMFVLEDDNIVINILTE